LKAIHNHVAGKLPTLLAVAKVFKEQIESNLQLNSFHLFQQKILLVHSDLPDNKNLLPVISQKRY